MNLVEFLQNLSAEHVKLWVDDNKLCYEAPKDVLTPELLTQIKQYKQEIIHLLQKRSHNPQSYPLSHGQRALWFLYQLASDSAAYNVTYAARLVSNVDIQALKKASQALIKRHSVLRTTFTTQDGEPVQTVHENQEVCFNVQEAFNWSQDDLNNWLTSQSDRPFDLERGPVLRVNLLIPSATTDISTLKEPILLITVHHIVSDFWSLELLVNELRVLYEAIKTGKEPSLPQKNLEYQDYVKWSNRLLTSSQGEQLWSYWRHQLAGELPILNLPTYKRPSVQTYNGATYSFALEGKLTQKLRELVKAEGVTLYTIILAAFQILLLRYTNQEDILIGSPMAGRSLAEFESIIGYFVNPVVLRADISGNPTFREFLYRVRSCVLGAIKHQDYPFPLLVERLQLPRDPSRSPLYQVSFVWDRSRHSEGLQVSLMDSDGLIVESFTPELKAATFDLTLTIFDGTGPLKGIWKYNTDLFDAASIARMAGQLPTLLDSIVANPNQKLCEIPLLSDAELQQLLIEWNDTQKDYASEQFIHQLFEEQVECTPDTVAVVFEDKTLTYQQLNSQANQLAHHLRSLGVEPEVLVGLCVERSLEMIVGLLGILKAGGAYVPFDPAYPTERLAFMLQDAQISVMLTQKHLVAKLPEYGAQVICLDSDREVIKQAQQNNLGRVVKGENLAYVIYTSGSTGQPKGVAIEHRQILNYLHSILERFDFPTGSSFATVSTLAADLGNTVVLASLCTGGQLHILSWERASTPDAFADYLFNHPIDYLKIVPSHLEALQNTAEPRKVLPRKGLILGGEACRLDWVENIRAIAPECRVFNHYGPTETTVGVLTYCVDHQKLLPQTQGIPLGRPLGNIQIYLLDSKLNPVPIGVVGEIYIGGSGVARGYLHKPDLTATKFIPNPFSKAGEAGGRLYKTGDTARYLPDGNIEFIGRVDDQVKVRGFRVELGEIEAKLRQHPQLQQAVVIVREDVPGDKRLVAYIVPHQEQVPTNTDLRHFLKQQLPEYMVPSAIVTLAALPLTPNGKVDRRSLPASESQQELSISFVAPRTPIEEMLALIWADVLRVEPVGINDNFFELGGHSLLAMQLLSRVRTTFKVEVPLCTLFEAATIAALAHYIQQWQQQGLELSTPPLLPVARDRQLALSFAQTRMWFLDQLEPNSAFYNISAIVRLQGQLNQAALEQSLKEIINRHESLRTNFITVDGQPVQIIHPETCWTLSVVDWQLLATTEQEIEYQQLVNTQTQQAFDLASESLVRLTLLLLSETEQILLVTVHHILTDGWSMGVAIQELARLYDAYCHGQASPLATLPIQYADFAQWQRQWLQADELQSQLAYWQQQLAGAPALLSLPTDRPRPAVQTFRGAHQFFALSVELTQALSQLSQREGVTLFMTLLAVFDILLYHYTGSEDIVVGSPIANRNHSEIEGLIGFFVNTLVLRTDVSGNPSFRELLGRVREMAMDAYAHQDLPFEMLVEALQPQRDLSHSPLFCVMFVLNRPITKIELPDLTMSASAVENSTAKFDLTLSLDNTDDGLLGSWEYNTDLFNASTIERMTGHFQTLLEGIVSNPEQKVGQLPLLTQTEQQQLLIEWNDTQQNYVTKQCIHQLFEEQVERTPDKVAVVFCDQQLTYRELNAKANQLAHYLRSVGVGADVLVGICVQRSLEMVVGLLGILKAGGAYVPLDPDYPPERLSFMLEDAAVSVLLTQQQIVAQLPQHRTRLVCLDTDWGVIDYETQENYNTQVQPKNLAYVIYTSGSTGRPKGVLITHNSLANHCCAIQQKYKLDINDRVLQFASINFDAASEQIFPTLIAGATLVLRDSEVWTASSFCQNILDLGLTVVDLPTTYWQQLVQQLVETPQLNVKHQLRLVIVGGDSILPESLTLWKQTPFSSVCLLNAYGPTEATITATLFEIPLQFGENVNLQKVPIGRPIAHKSIYILNCHLQPVPVGVEGELYIGGASLALGYLNRPDLTAERFIPDPFSNELGALLYKTGDLARYLPDGNIEFLGRIDHQVKIRGFRIELGEIEAVLNQHPQLQQAVVIAREDVLGNKRLVAYIVLHQEQGSTISDLRHFLKTKLPEYMVPAAFVILDSLPLTPNNKLDRRALLAPEIATQQPEADIVAPSTWKEELLAQIWREVLHQEQVGIHDNFFELGGDSILSIQIISKAHQAGLQLTVKQIFQHQTIAELAAVASTTQVVQAEQGLVSGALPLTPIQHWFIEQNLPESHHFNQAVLLEVPQAVDPAKLSQVVQQLLVHHDALRLRFVRSGEDWQLLNAAPDHTIPFFQVDLSALPEAEQKAAIETVAAELQASLNLTEGPLVRVGFFALGADKASRLLIVMHHLAVDGVSWRILLEDLQTGYQQLSRSEAIQFPPKTTSFQDWAWRLSQYARSGVLESELAYWLTPEHRRVLSIPMDYAGGANTIASARTLSVSLSVEETRHLLQEVPKAYKTQINDILLTALVQILVKWTGNNSVLLDLEGHGREDIFKDVDLSRTVGWFTTVFPVLLELKAVNNLGDAIKSIKEQLRAVPNRGIGYGLLRYLSGDAEITSTLQGLPQAEVIFNYLGQFNWGMQSDSLFKLASESVGPQHSLLGSRSHLLEINSIVVEGQLQLNWTYSENFHQVTTIEGLAQEYVQALRMLAVHCLSPDSGEYTPSDFPLAQLNQKELDKLLTELEEISNSGIKDTIEDIYPLSPAQQGILFHSLYAPEGGVYFQQLSWVFEGSLNVGAFEQALQRVVERHPILRTGFIWSRSDQPLQVVYHQVKIPLERHDWRGLSPIEQEQQLSAFLMSDRQRDFQLSKAPLMRLFVIAVGEDVYQLVWSSHHLLLDGWSLSLVIKEVFTVYEALCTGRYLQLEPIRLYRDYIAWLQKQDLAKAEVFWRQILFDFSAPTRLQVDTVSTNQENQHQNYSRQEIQLTVQLTEALSSFAQKQKLTLFTLVKGAWAMLLSRYNDEADVVFGVTVSGRSVAIKGVESLVGLLINTLPMRVIVSPDDELISWLKKIQNQFQEMNQYDYTPLVQIQGLCQIPQGLPLFESIVVFENYPVDATVKEQNFNLQVSDVRSIERTNYPLTVIAVPGTQLSLRLEYDCHRFDASTIERMIGHFLTLLEGIVNNQEQKVCQLPLLRQTEQQQLLIDWNDTQADYANEQCIHQLFEEQVERTPNVIAVEFDNQQLTYQQLNERANQLAHYLQSLGVEPEVFVGLSVERSLEMAIAVLAILKAGGAYVPLDPAYPRERLAFMLEDTRSRVLLTQSQLRSLFPESVADVVCLDQQSEIIAQQPSSNPKSSVSPNNLLYVIYTSGSTGQPKGITLSHQALGNLIDWHLETMKQGVGVMQFASLSFDASFHEMFAAWCSGGTLYMIPETLRQDVEKLVHFLAEKPIQKVILPVALWQQIAQVYEQQVDLFRHLTEVVTTGEQLQITQPIIDLFKQLNHCQLHNHYGPSETHVVTSFTFNSSPDTWPVYPPIGKPIANTQIYILDQHWQPVPIGIPGFLFIGGANLARGYLNRPDLTAQKFVSNPFGKGLLYQTGDLARYLPDGNIEFIGRVDDQVKVRGFRIELGEVEAVLNKHPQLSQAVVTVQGNAANEKRLVAYVVPKQGDTVTAEQLRQFLQQKLPEYAIPSAFVLLESLPLTPNQKVDRRALPTLDLDLSSSKEYVPPRTLTEEIIADIFATILKLEQVGIHSNFFELGGHSLLATRVVSRLRESFQVEIPLRTLFESPTVAELERAIAALVITDSGLIIPEIKPVARDSEHLPLSWAQERLWFLDRLQGESAAYNMPAALQISGQLNVEALEQALTEIIQRHSVLRTTFPTVNGTPVQAIAPTKVVTIPVVDLRSLPADEQAACVQQLATQEAQQPFDLANGPVIRFKLLQLAEQTHVLLVTLHHIIFDAWSISIFVRELVALYEAGLHQQSCVLPALSIQYTDFACWQRQWIQGEVLETQLSYWKQQLSGNLPVLQLPIDYPHSPTQNYQGAQQVLRLPNSLTTALKTLSRQEGVTLFMTLLAAFKVLLSRHSGQEDIIVGSPIAGRNHLETEKLIGFFLNTLPLRTYLGGNPSFRQLLTKVREITLAAYNHQDIPFEKLVEELRPERSLSRHPVFDVMFNMINTPEVALEIPGLTFEPLELTQPESKFFLTVFVQEAAESLNIKLVYRQNLFSSERMTAFLEQFEHLLQQIVAEPERSIQSYSLVTPQSRSLLPESSAPLDEPDYEPVTALFANWAQQAPQQTAIRQNGRTWSYQELSESAHTIAEVLLSCGVQPKDVVAVCGSRSFGLIASMLGVFLSGAVLLLVDSNLPTARQQLMIEQAQAKYLLVVGTQSKQASVTENLLEIIHVDSETATAIAPILGTSGITSLPTLTPGDHAYIFFTSGSTGTPKGVLGTHKGISHFLDWQRRTFEIKPGDRVAQLTSLTFDAVLRDVFLPLTSGATLCLPNVNNDFGSDRVLSWLDTEQITLVHTVPAVAQSWLTQVPEEIHLTKLRWIFFSGEPLTQTLVRQWRQTFPEAGQVVNLYGATETTMVKCFYRVPSEIPSGVMPAGWALPQTQALVLNPTNQLCGIGEIGEIIIRTPFRTLGYINASAEQQQRFVPNLNGNDQQDLFYYTGDKGRYRPDGAIEILGRNDDQIKIRGIRVQPGEIETVLNQHPAVAESVVIATEQTLGDKRLVAYVVAKLNQTFAEGDLRYFLKQQLPEYLVPSIFVMLDALPLTPNGKVNRRALPAPSVQVSKSASNLPPRTPTEEVIVNIFAEVLKLQHLGVDDNFFELGGHSLLATQVVSRIREALKVNLPLRTLFESPTPAELTVAIEKMKVTRGAEIDTPKITKISRERHRVQISSQEELTLPDTVRQKIFKSESKY